MSRRIYRMNNPFRYTIKASRERAGISLENMAYYLHVKVERYTKIENYEAGMTHKQGKYFSELVRISMDDISFSSPEKVLEIRNKVGYMDRLCIVYGSNERNEAKQKALESVQHG